MSSAELAPLFPSATHPAIPIAAQILATLRNLTAPGKGNDLRAEERAALVGVSALLGCERIQSKDLPESSAQKASSVSPAHFRSALARARRMLDTASTTSTSPSPTRRSARSSSHVSTDPAEAGPSTSAVDGTAVLAPFTPKKKFKYSSGLDISSLVRSPHSPAKASPLRQSTTASRVASAAAAPVGEHASQEKGAVEDDADAEQRTPSKRAKYGVKAGVDLERTPLAIPEHSSTSTKKRKRDDVSAFLALRPGSQPTSGGASTDDGEQADEDVEMEYIPSPPRAKKVTSQRTKRRKLRSRRDWTYRESLWTGKEVRATNIAKLEEVWARLDTRTTAGQQETKSDDQAASIVDVLLAVFDGAAGA